jgi:hypothetical protein
VVEAAAILILAANFLLTELFSRYDRPRSATFAQGLWQQPSTCCAVSTSMSQGHLDGDHRRLGHRQIGGAEMHPRPRQPDSGQITLDGQDVTKGDRDAFLARFGMLFQGGALFDSACPSGRTWPSGCCAAR